jgi:hypothetical protein
MINTLLQSPITTTAGQVVEVCVIKSIRRRLLEVVFYVWGVLGMLGNLLFARQAVSENVPEISQTAMLYTLIWIGGLVFLGLFALLTPHKVFLVNGGAAPLK